MSKRFIILFEQKEGSTPMIRLLNNFDKIDIVHQVSNRGWEPFDLHNVGNMPMNDYVRCLDLIFGPDEPYMDELNAVYTKTSNRALDAFDKRHHVGFKMRLRPHHRNKLLRWFRAAEFRRKTFDLLERHRVTVFVTVRQDVFRWALSMYHGNGTGQPGHLQFKLAKGEISRADIPPIKVEPAKFRPILNKFEERVAEKRMLIDTLKDRGIDAHPLLYEEFCADHGSFFRSFSERLGFDLSSEELQTALDRGTDLRKVHSDDIREFVTNADEILDAFGHRYVKWQ